MSAAIGGVNAASIHLGSFRAVVAGLGRRLRTGPSYGERGYGLSANVRRASSHADGQSHGSVAAGMLAVVHIATIS